MKLFPVAVISTVLVIAVGVGLVSQVFLTIADVPKQDVMISINVNDDPNLPQWCNELSSVLDATAIRATVFVAGKVAEEHPGCIEKLAANDRLDIGSQTYSYVSLPSIQDYTIQLEEVRNGKNSVDNTAKVDSRLFKAPFGKTNDEIYSLLNRSGIIADFSYHDHYNKYYEGQYIWFNVTSYEVTRHEPSYYNTLALTDTPLIINFDTSGQIFQLRDLVLQLQGGHFRFVNASDLTQLELTVRGKDQA